MICTFFEVFNIPVFWPILVMYFITLFCITMKRQIKVSLLQIVRLHRQRMVIKQASLSSMCGTFPLGIVVSHIKANCERKSPSYSLVKQTQKVFNIHIMFGLIMMETFFIFEHVSKEFCCARKITCTGLRFVRTAAKNPLHVTQHTKCNYEVFMSARHVNSRTAFFLTCTKSFNYSAKSGVGDIFHFLFPKKSLLGGVTHIASTRKFFSRSM